MAGHESLTYLQNTNLTKPYSKEVIDNFLDEQLQEHNVI